MLRAASEPRHCSAHKHYTVLVISYTTEWVACLANIPTQLKHISSQGSASNRMQNTLERRRGDMLWSVLTVMESTRNVCYDDPTLTFIQQILPAASDTGALTWPAPESITTIVPGTGRISMADPLWSTNSVQIPFDPNFQHLPSPHTFEWHSASPNDLRTRPKPISTKKQSLTRHRIYNLGRGATRPALTPCETFDGTFSAIVGSTSSKLITFALSDATIPPQFQAGPAFAVHPPEVDQAVRSSPADGVESSQSSPADGVGSSQSSPADAVESSQSSPADGLESSCTSSLRVDSDLVCAFFQSSLCIPFPTRCCIVRTKIL